MTDIEATAPCARGCTWDSLEEDEAPRPKAATHGLLCTGCFYRVRRSLDVAPELMANMRAMVVPSIAPATSERVSGGGGGSPAPLNIGAVDAGDSLFAKLVSWTGVFAEELGFPVPSVSSWFNMREVQGSRPVSPHTAGMLTTQLASWFIVHLDDIAGLASASAFHDDLIDGWEDAPGIFALQARYGVDARPARPASKRECPLCGERAVFVKTPNAFDADVDVMCERCEWVANPQEYPSYNKIVGELWPAT